MKSNDVDIDSLEKEVQSLEKQLGLARAKVQLAIAARAQKWVDDHTVGMTMVELKALQHALDKRISQLYRVECDDE